MIRLTRIRKNKINRNEKRGVSLIEVLIAIVVILIASLGFIASVVFSQRTAIKAKTDSFALEVMNRVIEEMRLARFSELGTNEGDGVRFESPIIFESDPENLSMSIQCTVNVNFKGFGEIDSVGSSSLDVNFEDGDPTWNDDEWAGSMLMITSGASRGQVVYITGNDEDTLNITSDLDGSSNDSWIREPEDGDEFMIDYGKYAVIRVTWADPVSGRMKGMTRRALIPFGRDE